MFLEVAELVGPGLQASAAAMSLLIEDGETLALLDELARRLGVSGEAAVRRVVETALNADADKLSFDTRWAEFRRRLPKPTGLPADKALYDELSGDL